MGYKQECGDGLSYKNIADKEAATSTNVKCCNDSSNLYS